MASATVVESIVGPVCLLCNEGFPTSEMYHKHNMSQHTHEQLSMALMGIMNKQLPTHVTQHIKTNTIASDYICSETVTQISSEKRSEPSHLYQFDSRATTNSFDNGILQISVNSAGENFFNEENGTGSNTPSGFVPQSKQLETVSSGLLQKPAPQKIMSQMMGLDEEDHWPELGDDITLINDEELLSTLDLFPSLLDDFVIELDARDGSGALTIQNTEQSLTEGCTGSDAKYGSYRTHASDKDLCTTDNSAPNLLRPCDLPKTTVHPGKTDLCQTNNNSSVDDEEIVQSCLKDMTDTTMTCKDHNLSEVCDSSSGKIKLCEETVDKSACDISQITNDNLYFVDRKTVEKCVVNSSNESSLIDVEELSNGGFPFSICRDNSTFADDSMAREIQRRHEAKVHITSATQTIACSEDGLTDKVSSLVNKENDNIPTCISREHTAKYSISPSSTPMMSTNLRCITTVAPTRRTVLTGIRTNDQTIERSSVLASRNEHGIIVDSGLPKVFCVPSNSNKSFESRSSIRERKRSQFCHPSRRSRIKIPVLSTLSKNTRQIQTRSGRVIKERKIEDYVYGNLSASNVNVSSTPLHCNVNDKKDKPHCGTITLRNTRLITPKQAVTRRPYWNDEINNFSVNNQIPILPPLSVNLGDKRLDDLPHQTHSLASRLPPIDEVTAPPNITLAVRPFTENSPECVSAEVQNITRQALYSSENITRPESSSSGHWSNVIRREMRHDVLPSQPAVQLHFNNFNTTDDHEFTCHCGNSFHTQLLLSSHHDEQRCTKLIDLFICQVCNHKFDKEIKYNKHLKIIHPEFRLECHVCDRRFSSTKSLKSHLQMHQKKNVFTCPYCSKSYYVRSDFNRHFRNHFRKYSCPVCSKRYSNKQNYDQHLADHEAGRLIGRGARLRCTNCGDYRDKSLINSLNTEDSGYHKACLKCGKGLYKEYSLSKIVVGKEPMAAQVNATSNSHMKKHSSKHACPHCDALVLDVAKHIKRVHQQLRVICDICKKSVKKDCLQAHKNRIHSRAMNVFCDHCNKNFKNAMSLREHMTRVRRKLTLENKA